MTKKVATCALCGNKIHSSDTECQSGGPMPDGCALAQYGVRDKLREVEKIAK